MLDRSPSRFKEIVEDVIAPNSSLSLWAPARVPGGLGIGIGEGRARGAGDDAQTNCSKMEYTLFIGKFEVRRQILRSTGKKPLPGPLVPRTFDIMVYMPSTSVVFTCTGTYYHIYTHILYIIIYIII